MCDGAVSNVGPQIGGWIIALAFFTGGFAIILAALVEGKTQNAAKEAVTAGFLCMLLFPFGGWLVALILSCKISSASG